MKYIFVDFEMNPIAKEYRKQRMHCGREIIQIGAVMLDETFREISMFKSYVKPEFNTMIYKKFEELTGISTAQVATAGNFNQVMNNFLDWCGQDEYEIYAWSTSDKIQIEKEMYIKKLRPDTRMNYMFEHWLDFQKIFMEIVEEDKLISLEKALNACGIPFSGKQHDALYDARNTSRLFVESKRNDVSQCIKSIKKAMECTEEKTTLGDMFNFAALGLQLA